MSSEPKGEEKGGNRAYSNESHRNKKEDDPRERVSAKFCRKKFRDEINDLHFCPFNLE